MYCRLHLLHHAQAALRIVVKALDQVEELEAKELEDKAAAWSSSLFHDPQDGLG